MVIDAGPRAGGMILCTLCGKQLRIQTKASPSPAPPTVMPPAVPQAKPAPPRPMPPDIIKPAPLPVPIPRQPPPLPQVIKVDELQPADDDEPPVPAARSKRRRDRDDDDDDYDDRPRRRRRRQDDDYDDDYDDEPRGRRRREPANQQVVSITNVVHATGGYRFPHAFHLILTLLTCGLWLPIWILHYLAHAIFG